MHAHASLPALGPELARAHQADHLAAADLRRAGRQLAVSRRGARAGSRRRHSRVPIWPVRLTGRSAV